MIDLAPLRGSRFAVLGLARSGLATMQALSAGGLQSAKIRGKLDLQAPSLLDAPGCTSFVDVGVGARFDKAGRYLAKKSRVKLKGKARALPGTKPRTDSDKWVLQCLPRLTACPAASD